METLAGQPHEREQNNIDLLRRLNNWVKERSFYFRQRKVRQDIATAITTDILDPVNTFSIPPQIENYRANVDKALAIVMDKLSTNTTMELPEVKDSITGDLFRVRIRREESEWISEEVRPNGELISQARIGDRGELRLTLNFPGSNYEKKDANPKLDNASEFPTGTKVLFLNQAAILGVISWKGN